MKIIRFLFLLFLIGCSSSENENPTMKENLPPNSFSLINVGNNSENVSLSPSFTWGTATDPEGDLVTYQFILDTNPDPTTVMADGLDSTSFTITDDLKVDTLYYWKVVAIDENQNIRESTISKFTTRSLILSVQQITENAAFSARNSHSMITFNNKLWIIGGSFKEDVWFSADGVEWTLATSNAPFGRRSDHTSVVFNNKIWVIGGNIVEQDSQTLVPVNDVWSSTDGIQWDLQTDSAEFSPRRLHSSVVFDNKIWVINGFNDTPFGELITDVWYSSNGEQWNLATDSPNITGLVQASLVFDNKIWIIGGNSNNVYNSTDGVTWEVVTDNASFSPRNVSAGAVYENRMWIFGGEASSIDNQIWYTSDGKEWFMATQSPTSYSNRFTHKASTLNNKIYLSAGVSSPFTGNFNDVWEIALQ